MADKAKNQDSLPLKCSGCQKMRSLLPLLQTLEKQTTSPVEMRTDPRTTVPGKGRHQDETDEKQYHSQKAPADFLRLAGNSIF